MLGRSKPRTHKENTQQNQPATLQLIAEKLEKLVWRRRLWGIDERQVWHVVQRLDEMYREIYERQEIHYQALLEQKGVKLGNLPEVPQTPQPMQPVSPHRRAGQPTETANQWRSH